MSEWRRTHDGVVWLAPEDVEVCTKIHDEHGERNVAKLTRQGNLWWTDLKDGMYVYYTPTHWRPV